MAKRPAERGHTNGKKPGLVPMQEVCDTLGIHRNTALRHRDDFPLEIITIGSRLYCRRADLSSFLRTPA